MQCNVASVSCVRYIFSHVLMYKSTKSFLVNYLANQNRVDCPKPNGSCQSVWSDWVQLELHVVLVFMLHVG